MTLNINFLCAVFADLSTEPVVYKAHPFCDTKI